MPVVGAWEEVLVLTQSPFHPVQPPAGILGDAVASHPFWGTQAIVDSMRRRNGFSDGVVEIDVTSPVRDPSTGLVVDFA